MIQLAAQTLQSFFSGGGRAREHAEYPLADVVLRAPVLHPPSVRDFYAFEQHVKTAREARGAEVPKEWYESRSSTSRTRPRSSGPRTSPVSRGDARSSTTSSRWRRSSAPRGAIGGFTVMNDWSARDLQRAEMKVGLGPAKGKDFATSLGPVVVTPDEFDGSTGGDGRARQRRGALPREPRATCTTPGSGSSPRRRATPRLLPGDVLGSGTVGTGCILEHGDGRWLEPRRRGRARGGGDRRAAEHGRAA